MLFTRKIPRYWIDNKTMVWTTILTILFSILFLLIYGPFSATSWLSLIKVQQPNYFQIVLASISFYLVALAILVLSKFILHTIQRKHPFNLRNILLWVLVEAVTLSLVYTLFTEVFIIPDPALFLPILGRSFLVMLFILFIPYTIGILIATTIHQRKLLNRMTLRVQKGINDDPQLIPLIDNTGKLKLTINIDALYYVESQDNYVKIYYEMDGKICNYMLRCTTKDIEDKFKGHVIRCHRSYIVNKNKIASFNNKRDNLFLTLNHNDLQPIPVSRTYVNLIQEVITH